VDGRIDSLFSTASLRYGHVSYATQFPRYASDGSAFAHGPLLLRDWYFNPTFLDQTDANGEGGLVSLRGRGKRGRVVKGNRQSRRVLMMSLCDVCLSVE
jgi:hypothetical protein